MDKDKPSKVSLGDRPMPLGPLFCHVLPEKIVEKCQIVARTITYLDDDILILRDDRDPLVFLEGRLQNFYVKREIYLRSSPSAAKPLV